MNPQLSDDEDDLHPNIDKDSWFRMKARPAARIRACVYMYMYV
jgi:hypothetical protein